MKYYGNLEPAAERKDRIVGWWLLSVAILVFIMVLLGGATRLTHSGLSMVDWNLISGVMPPMSKDEWDSSFREYQKYPEFKKINQGMTIEQFKRIFYFEYMHRLLGRIIGLAFILPFAWFLIGGWILKERTAVLACLLVLGGIQGAVGWWMVQSGLVDRPDVSQYRLMVHLGLAVLIFSILLWIVMGCFFSNKKDWCRCKNKYLILGMMVAVLVCFIQILSGALVAGLDAGFIYNTFPKMNEFWMPPELFDLTPFWLNFFENPVTAQFDHRFTAFLLLFVVIVIWLMARRYNVGPQGVVGLRLTLLFLIIQFALGVATLLTDVNLFMAILHQGTALLCLSVLIFSLHRVRFEDE